MRTPTILSGKLITGDNITFGEGVVINVAEEVVIGDRVVIPDRAYISGRKITIGSDFYGYTHPHSSLDIGRGRISHEDAILTIGDRCTLHNNKIDLSRQVTLGNDVGLSPEVTIYTHGYWQSPLEGFPYHYAKVQVDHDTIIGYRSVLLPGADVPNHCIIGAQSVVTGVLTQPHCIYAGNPAVFKKEVFEPSRGHKQIIAQNVYNSYLSTCVYRNLPTSTLLEYPYIVAPRFKINLETKQFEGVEDQLSSDLRWFLFSHGIRIYTKCPFHSLPGM